MELESSRTISFFCAATARFGHKPPHC